MPRKPFESSQIDGTLAAGASIPVHLLEYFALVLGSGVTLRTRGRGNNGFILPVNFVFGDGEDALGTVELVNPTLASITYRILTCTRQFKADSPFNGIVTGFDAAGAAATGNPLLVAGTDGASVRTLLTDAGGRQRVAGADAEGAAFVADPLAVAGEARSSERAGVANAHVSRLITDLVGKLITLPYANPENQTQAVVQLIAAGVTDLVPSAGAGLRTYLTTIHVANGGAAADVAIIYDGAVEVGRLWVPIKDSRSISLPVPWKGSVATKVRVDIGGASNDMRFFVAGYTGQ